MSYKIDGGTLQDLHHYSLAMQGKDCAFDSGYLSDRLEAASGVYRILTCLDMDEPNIEQWDPFIVERWKSEADLRKVGRALHAHVLKVAKSLGISSYTGDKRGVESV